MTTKLPMKRGNAMIEVSAAKVSERLPGAIAVGAVELQLLAKGAARWTKGAVSGDATIRVTPVTKTSAAITVTLERPKGPQAFLYPRATLRRIEDLLAQALAYEIETRTVEERSAFDIRRTSPDLVRSRAS
jgi:hypothetical protein